MESIQFIFWLYMENVCVYHVSSSCLRVSAAFSLTIVLFVEELCALRLTCASSLRFNQGFRMEWIKYQHNEVIISQTPPTIFILRYIRFCKKGKGWIKQDVVKINPGPFKIHGLNIAVNWYPFLVCQVRSIFICKRKHVIIKAKRGDTFITKKFVYSKWTAYGPVRKFWLPWLMPPHARVIGEEEWLLLQRKWSFHGYVCTNRALLLPVGVRWDRRRVLPWPFGESLSEESLRGTHVGIALLLRDDHGLTHHEGERE